MALIFPAHHDRARGGYPFGNDGLMGCSKAYIHYFQKLDLSQTHHMDHLVSQGDDGRGPSLSPHPVMTALDAVIHLVDGHFGESFVSKPHMIDRADKVYML
jgi:hypothetical protein